jgi:hypothetical protein
MVNNTCSQGCFSWGTGGALTRDLSTVRRKFNKKKVPMPVQQYGTVKNLSWLILCQDDKIYWSLNNDNVSK